MLKKYAKEVRKGTLTHEVEKAVHFPLHSFLALTDNSQTATITQHKSVQPPAEWRKHIELMSDWAHQQQNINENPTTPTRT